MCKFPEVLRHEPHEIMLKLKTEQKREPSQQKVRHSEYIKEYDLTNNQLHTADLLSPATP